MWFRFLNMPLSLSIWQIRMLREHGLKFQEAILKRVAAYTGKSYRTSDPEEEAKGIDGYIGDHPVSIKPQTYESKQMLPESIGVQIIYYEKVKDGINIFFDEF
jgi:hypothetical protein